MISQQDFFASDPEQARQRFRQGLTCLQERWPDARFESHKLPDYEHEFIDVLQAEAIGAKDKLLLITTGLHGVEAMIGSAVLQLFMAEFLPGLNPATCGVYLVHPLNPWGMGQWRRVNAQNVDLNRNFLAQDQRYDPSFNQDYDRLRFLLQPEGMVGLPWFEKIRFSFRLALALLKVGPDRLMAATLEGQYRQPQGLYYGGSSSTNEADWLRQFIRYNAQKYNQLCWLDIHSGYGPRNQMTLVDSPLEPRDPAEQVERLGYPSVVQAEASTFYNIHGDMLDAAYHWFEGLREPRFYATAFEFGTFGDSIGASLRSLRTMILENQLWHNGASSTRAENWVNQEFMELFLPREPAWRNKAMADASRALKGILQAEGFTKE